MPLHQNQDGTWQWGKSGKKYKSRKKVVRQMKAIFANGYVSKHASYRDVLGQIKNANIQPFKMTKQAQPIQTTRQRSNFVSPVNVQNPNAYISTSPYVAQNGDTLFKFYSTRDKNFNIPYQEYERRFRLANNLQDTAKIIPGKSYKLPSRDLPSQRFARLGTTFGKKGGDPLSYTNFLSSIGFDAPNAKIRKNDLYPLGWDYRLYGADPTDPDANRYNAAVRVRYQLQQKRRAQLAGQTVNDPTRYYSVPLNAIYSTNLSEYPVSKPLKELGPLQYEIEYKKDYDSEEGRAHADWSFWNTRLGKGLLNAKTHISEILHQLGHSSTPVNVRVGTQNSPKNFQNALSGDPGADASGDWWQEQQRLRRQGLRYPQTYLTGTVHPMSNYYNSGVQALTGMHQLMGLAAAHGRAFKNWNQLLPWMMQQGYVNQDKNGELGLRQGQLPDQIRDGATGLSYFLRYQNYLRALEYKKRRGGLSPQQEQELVQGRKRLNLISQVADNRTYDNRKSRFV